MQKKRRSPPSRRSEKRFPARAFVIGGILLALLLAGALALLLSGRLSAPKQGPPDAATLARLAGRRTDGGDWHGAGSLKVGDLADRLYAALPSSSLEEQPDAYALLYAEGLDANNLPLPPYGVLVPSDDLLRAHLVAKDGAGYALADFYIDPDSGRIVRIEWAVEGEDPLLEQLLY